MADAKEIAQGRLHAGLLRAIVVDAQHQRAPVKEILCPHRVPEMGYDAGAVFVHQHQRFPRGNGPGVAVLRQVLIRAARPPRLKVLLTREGVEDGIGGDGDGEERYGKLGDQRYESSHEGLHIYGALELFADTTAHPQS